MSALIAVLSALLPFTWGMPVTFRATWTLIVFALIALFLLMGRAKLRPSGATWIMATYFAAIATVIAGFQADNVLAHVQNGLYIVLLWGIAPPVFRWISAEKPNLLRAAAVGFVVGQTASSAVSVIQAATGTTVLGIVAEFGRAPGLSGHPNILGLLGAVAVLICVTHLGPTRPLRVAGATAAAVNFAGVIGSGSLTAALALVVGVFTIAIVHRVRLKILVSALVFLGLVGVIFVAVASSGGVLRTPLERFMQVTGQTQYVSTATTRAQTFDAAWVGIGREPLLGVGLDDASGVTTLALDGEVVTHNLLLRAWFQGGLALLVAVVLIYVHTLRLLTAAVRARAAACEAGVIAGMMVFALTSATLQQPYFWLVMIASASSAAWKLQDHSPPRTSPGRLFVETARIPV